MHFTETYFHRTCLFANCNIYIFLCSRLEHIILFRYFETVRVGRRVIVPSPWKYFRERRRATVVGRVCVRGVLCVNRETGRRTTHGVCAESMWQSAVDTLVMALGRRDEIGDAIRCISADEGCNLARTPFIKAASLPRRIQGYRCCQHQRLREQQQRISPATSSATEPDRQDVAFPL